MSFGPKKVAANQWMVRCGLCGDKILPKRHFVSDESPAIALAEAEKYAARHRESVEHRAAVKAFDECAIAEPSPEERLIANIFGDATLPDGGKLRRRAARRAAASAQRAP
jgi:hypothetical protein